MAPEAPTPAPEPTPTPAPTAAPTPEPTPTPVLLAMYDEFGFSLKLDRGADVQSAGWTGPEPSEEQGLITFAYGGVNTIMTWNPPEGATPLSLVNNIYQVLQNQQPDVTFDTINEGEIPVSGESGFFAGFKTVGAGSAAEGGLIGGWICSESDIAYTLTTRGEDATVVQLRFDRLLENFTCSA